MPEKVNFASQSELRGGKNRQKQHLAYGYLFWYHHVASQRKEELSEAQGRVGLHKDRVEG